ncbi:MAG: ribosome silencing factor [Bacteroidia bacterium]|nr:ribosome silencing factor [Bacteroidia bacterium]
MPKTKRATSKGLLKAIIEGIQDKKGEDIISIELSGIENAVCKYFVICHANTNIQVRAIAENIEKHVKNELNENVWHVEGKENSQWLLLDYIDIVVHIFQQPFREFYNLEGLWADANINRIN